MHFHKTSTLWNFGISAYIYTDFAIFLVIQYLGKKGVEHFKTLQYGFVATFSFLYQTNLTDLINFYFHRNHQKTIGFLIIFEKSESN